MIYDVGMGNGDDTAYYLESGYRVVAIEADATRAEAGRIRFAGRPVEVVEAAISDQTGFAEFWVNTAHPDFSSLFPEVATRGAQPRKERVRTVTLGDLFDKFGTPFYLKVDIERADGHCLRALVGRTDRPAYVSVEAHSLEYLDLLEQAGYDEFKCVDQTRLGRLSNLGSSNAWGRLAGWTDRQLGRVRRRVLKLKERYAYGSSGPFGEDTPGRWLKKDEANRQWSSIKDGKGGGLFNPSSWFDFHARQAPPRLKT